MKTEVGVSQYIKSFFKIGAIGFGGGSSLIPVTEAEIVRDKKLITEEDFNRHCIVANITPGALPLKLAILSSDRWSVFCAYALLLPSFLIMLLINIGFSLLGEQAIKIVECLAIGISTFIILLLYMYIEKVVKASRKTHDLRKYILITVMAFLVTCGSEVRGLLQLFLPETIFGTPFLDISVLNLMLTTLFFIGFTGASKSRLRYFGAVALSVLFVLSSGKMKVIGGGFWIPALLVAAVLAAMIYDTLTNKSQKTEKEAKRKRPYIVRNLIIFWGIAAALSVCSIIFIRTTEPTVLEYVVNSVISSFSSFGGGEAFVSVADGFFVQNGFVDAGVFYGRIVAVANSLPGPILPNILEGIGYLFGSAAGGAGLGVLLSVNGMSIAVATAATVAIVVDVFFDTLRTNARIIVLQRYIPAVICGMLISTMLSVLKEALKIFTHVTPLGIVVTSLIVVVLFAALMLLHKKLHWPDLLLLLIGGGVTLAVCLIFG